MCKAPRQYFLGYKVGLAQRPLRRFARIAKNARCFLLRKSSSGVGSSLFLAAELDVFDAGLFAAALRFLGFIALCNSMVLTPVSLYFQPMGVKYAR